MSAKTCGSCSMCCKLLTIEELSKPGGIWCPHVTPGKGCTIYADRPTPCRTFVCNWLHYPAASDAWRPDRCGFIMRETAGKMLRLDVEPSRPDAWRREPFYSQIKQWAAAAVARRGAVFVSVGPRITMVLPDKDVPVGEPAEGDTFTVAFEVRDGVRRNYIRVTHADGSHTDYDA